MSSNYTLSHLLIVGRAKSEPYVYPGQPPFDDIELPPRDRATHSQKLLGEISQARVDNEAARGVVAPEETPAGIVLEIRSDPGLELKLDSLENRTQNIELNSVRIESGVQIATVFVPDGKLNHFQRVLQTYASENVKSGLPKNQKLAESIASIGLARLKSFWTDTAPFPESDGPHWWEIWLRADGNQDAVLGIFQTLAQSAGLNLGSDRIRFPDRLVLLCRGTATQLSSSLSLLDLIAEIRIAKENPAAFAELPPQDQGEWVKALVERLASPPNNSPKVCILDAGIQLHPLLTKALKVEDLFKHHPDWPLTDAESHGTEMAGVALFGDGLASLLSNDSTVTLSHRLESVKILPPSPLRNEPRLFGDITAQAVFTVEVSEPSALRVFCLAVSYPDGRDNGQPSSWSAHLDQIAAGVHDDTFRLIVVSAGNSSLNDRKNYPDANDSDRIHDPAQSWNALTVGAYTDLVQFPTDTYPDWRPLATAGSLSPSSTTSVSWDQEWPIKPDIVLEGGNAVIDPTGTLIDTPEQMAILTTAHGITGRLLTVLGDTSAATALAARMAAIVQAKYPTFWPETVRALLVHSAAWTQPMSDSFSNNKLGLQKRLRRYGYGVPSLDRALSSAKNSLALISQETFQPFDKVDGKMKTKDMKIHALPWPVAALQSLGAAPVTMRVTLSYFIAPSPGRRGWTRRHRYQSHGLRFDVRRPEESLDDFRQRMSKAARDEDEEYDGPVGTADGWVLGKTLRTKGSIHCDWWQGTASQLAACGNLAVFPITGWWRERHHLNCWSREARYSLVVTIHTDDTEIDLYTPIRNQIATDTQIDT